MQRGRGRGEPAVQPDEAAVDGGQAAEAERAHKVPDGKILQVGCSGGVGVVCLPSDAEVPRSNPRCIQKKLQNPSKYLE